MKNVLLKILDVFKIIILVILVFFVIATAYQKVGKNNPSIFGFRTFSIITNSMSPVLKKGDVILVKELDIKKYKKDDIITYRGMDEDLKGKIVTHQIVGFKDEKGRRIFYTKGIRNISDDPAVYEDQVLGKYIYKFKVFSIVEKIMSTKIGFVLIIIIPLGFIYFYEIKDIILNVKKIKNS